MVLGIILVGLIILAYKVIFVAEDDSATVDNSAATARAELLLQKVNSIKFDTQILQDEKFKSLKSLDIPLISLPIGRYDPFSGSR